MRLLVAEKPSVARTLKEMLEKLEGERFSQRDGYFESRDWWVSWCVGHLVGLEDPEAYGWEEWRLEDLPMIPNPWKLAVLPSTAKQFHILKELMGKAAFLVNGTDAGREGELIYRLVAEKAGASGKPQFRLWLNSFVPADMEKAWRNREPSQQYDSLYRSALCRAKADWLIGMNLSRGYALGTKTRKLSVGRVQTPTLALIVRRDLEIGNWKDRFFYQLQGAWRGLRFIYVKAKETRFDSPASLEPVRQACEGRPARLVAFEKQARRQFPPKPFDLAELQKVANKVLALKAATTLEIAQSLYEKKWVTYPRTDSAYLPEGMEEEAWSILGRVATVPERDILRPRTDRFAFFDSAKVSDHFAIIPTGAGESGNTLEEKEQKVYELIRSRFVVAFGAPYEFEEYNLELECEGHAFKARATYETKKGFKALFKETASKEGRSSEEEPGNTLERALGWSEGEVDPLTHLRVTEGKATKPTHYTEATLLTAMETAGKDLTEEAMREAMKERGLGTPATKAAIIERLKDQEYILAQGKHLLSTAKGRGLIRLVDEKVASPEMTGEWEWKLNRIAKGDFSDEVFLQEIKAYVAGLKSSFTSERAAAFAINMAAEMEPCPKCKQGKLRENKHGLFCEDKDSCGFKLWSTVAEKKLSGKQLSDLLEKGRSNIIKGFKSRAGKKFDAALKLVDWKVVFDFPEKAPEPSQPAAPSSAELGQCPKCKSHPVVQGKFGFECRDWRGCGFKVFRSMAKRELTMPEVRELLTHGRTPILEGFQTREGKPFRAALALGESKEVKLVFA
jgi:DNA topoisomerase III